MAVSDQGDLLIAADFDSLENHDLEISPQTPGDNVSLIAFDENGNHQWHQTIEFQQEENLSFKALHIFQDTLVAGLVLVSSIKDKITIGTNTIDSTGLYLITFDFNGKLQNIRLLGRGKEGGFMGTGYAFHIDKKNNVLIHASIREDVILGDSSIAETQAGTSAIYAKINAAGKLEFVKFFGGTIINYPQSLHYDQETGHSYVYGGFTQDPLVEEGPFLYEGKDYQAEGGRDLYLIKFNETGQMVWVKILGGSDQEYARDFQKSDASIYLSGDYTGAIQLGNTFLNTSYDNSTFIAKMDTFGAFRWAQSFDGNDDVAPTNITLKEDQLYTSINFSKELMINDEERIDHSLYDTANSNIAIIALDTSGTFDRYLPVTSENHTYINKFKAHPTYSDQFIAWLTYQSSITINKDTLSQPGNREVLLSSCFSEIDETLSAGDWQKFDPKAKLYPTITSGHQLNLQMPNSLENKEALSGQIVNMNGKVLKTIDLQAGQNPKTIQLPQGLAKGVYFLNLQGNAYQQTFKFIKR